MDWSNFRDLVNQHLPTIIAWATALIVSFISLLITLIKTRSKAIQKKAQQDLGIDLNDYVVEVGDETFDLRDLKIKKKGVANERQSDEKKK